MEVSNEVGRKEELLELVGKSLADGETNKAMNAITNPKYASSVETSAWDLMPSIVQHLSSSNKKLSSGAHEILMALVEHASPEEMLLELIEKAEGAKKDVCFLALLQAMQRTLSRMPEKRGRSLQWCLNTISQRLTSADGSDDSESEEENEKGDQPAQRALTIYRASLEFCSLFIEEVSLSSSCKSFDKPVLVQRERERRILQTFLLQLLSQTATTADLLIIKENKNPCRVFAEDIIHALCNICSDFLFILMYMEARSKTSQELKTKDIDQTWEEANPFLYEEVVPITGLGVLYYLVLVEKVRAEYAPNVYDPQFIFQNILHVVVGMISCPDNNAVYKGLQLADVVLKRLGRPPLPAGILDDPVQRKFCITSLQTVFRSGNVSTSRQAVSVFKTYLKSFSLKGQYHILKKLYSVSPEQGIRGFLVGQLKDSVDRSLKEHSSEEGVELFRGTSLFEVITRFSKVGESSEDVGDHADHLIAILNLFWYLVLCKNSEELGLSNRVEWFEEKMEDFGEAVNKCRAKYEHDKAVLKRENRGDQVMKMGGVLSAQEQLQAVESTINKLVLIDSLLTDVDKALARWRKND